MLSIGLCSQTGLHIEVAPSRTLYRETAGLVGLWLLPLPVVGFIVASMLFLHES
jgi:hypothetical protein